MFSSVVGLFFISHCGKCEDRKMKSAVSSDHSVCYDQRRMRRREKLATSFRLS